MPEMVIHIPSQLLSNMQKLTANVKRLDEVTNNVKRAAAQTASATRPSANTQPISLSHMTGLFRRTDQLLQRFDTVVLRNIDRMIVDVGPIGRMLIRGLPPISQTMLDVSPILRVAGLGTGPFAIIGAVGYAGYQFLSWLWTQSSRLGAALTQENRQALTTGATIGGLRALRIGFAMLPVDPEFEANIALLRHDAASRRAVALKLLGVQRQITSTAMMVQAMLAAQRFMQAQPRGLELQMAEAYGLTDVFKPDLLLKLRTMKRPEMEKAAAWILANERNLTPPDFVRKSLMNFYQTDQLVWQQIQNVFGERLAKSGLVDALTKVTLGMTNLTDKIASIKLPVAAVAHFIDSLKQWVSALSDIRDAELEVQKFVSDKTKQLEQWAEDLRTKIDNLIAQTSGPAPLSLPVPPSAPALPPPVPSHAALPRRGRPAIGHRTTPPAPPSTSATPRGAPPPSVSTPQTPRGAPPAAIPIPAPRPAVPAATPAPRVTVPTMPAAPGQRLPLYSPGYLPSGVSQAIPPGWQAMRPPPGARIDRSQFDAELADPAVRQRLAWMVNGEVGKHASEEQRQIQLETVFNRAQARGISLKQALKSVGEGRGGYYATTTYRPGQAPTAAEQERFDNGVLASVRGGSDLGTQRFGFTPTGNASGLGFAARRAAAGDRYYAASQWFSGRVGVGEMYALERYDRDLVDRLPRTTADRWLQTPWPAPPPQVDPLTHAGRAGPWQDLPTYAGARNFQPGTVDPRLREILSAAKTQFETLHPGYSIQGVSGRRYGANIGAGPHGSKTGAIDMIIVGPNGKALGNEGADETGLYHEYARIAKGEQQARYPELNKMFAWGGAFGTRKGGGGPPDNMHFDLSGERGHWYQNQMSTMGPLPGLTYGQQQPKEKSDQMPKAKPIEHLGTPFQATPDQTNIPTAHRSRNILHNLKIDNRSDYNIKAADTAARIGGGP